MALGADYVMLGEIVARSEEACAPVRDFGGREYYGMSTEKAQFMINESSAIKQDNFEPKHSEGIHKWIPVDYSINEWLKDFAHALRSSMSYLNIRDISLLMGNVDWEVMSINSYNTYNNGK